MTLPKSSVSFEMVQSANVPPESPLPANDMQSVGMLAALNPSANATTNGRSLLPVTPWPMMTMKSERASPACTE